MCNHSGGNAAIRGLYPARCAWVRRCPPGGRYPRCLIHRHDVSPIWDERRRWVIGHILRSRVGAVIRMDRIWRHAVAIEGVGLLNTVNMVSLEYNTYEPSACQ